MPNQKSRNWSPPEGAYAHSVAVMMELMRLPKFDLWGDDALENLKAHCDRYLNICLQQDYLPGRENFAASLHIPQQTLSKLINGTKGGRPLPSGVQDKLIEMDAMFQALTADGMLNGQTNTIGSIFELKNMWGYKDQTEVVTVRKNEALTGEELKALAESLPDVIDGEYHEVLQIGDGNEEKD